MTGLQILVIDDDEVLNANISKFLGVYNDVSTVTSVAAARNALERQDFGALLLDRTLPDGSGLDFLSEIKRLWPFVPIIIMMADPDFNAVQKAIVAGADDFLIKSEQIVPDLMVRIQVAINSARNRRVAALLGRFATLTLPSSREEFTPHTFQQFMHEAEKVFISTALDSCNGSVALASEMLGLARSTLFKRIAEFKISRRGVESLS